VDGGRWTAGDVVHTVDVRGVEIEPRARNVLALHLHDRAARTLQAVLDDDAVADVDGSRGQVVVVVARVLLVRPALEPDVEVHLAVELDERPLVGVVAREIDPEGALTADGGGEVRELLAGELGVGRNAFGDPASGRG